MLSGCRILMTTDAVGGIWTYSLDLARGLAREGAAVTLAVLGPDLDAGRRARAEREGLAVRNTGCAPEWLAHDAEEVQRSTVQVAQLARDTGTDLIHLNHPALAGCAALPCPAVGVAHSCVATWWAAVRGTPLPADFAWRTALVGDGYRSVDRLVAPSRAFADATRRAYGLAAGPTVVPNGRAAAAAPRAEADPVRAVFSAGRLWDEGKNAVALDRAAEHLPCPVRLAGPTAGPNGARIAFAHAEALGTLGEAEVGHHLAARPVYAAPAFYEPFGLAVLEAAQAGCALVLSDIATLRELWDGAAVLVDPRDADALAAAFGGLLDDPERRRALGLRARERAARYTAAAALAGMTAVYGSVLAGRGGATSLPAA